jgi:hypothetical protein
MFNKIKKVFSNRLVQIGALVALSPALARATDPTTIDGVSDLSTGFMTKATAAAVASGILGFGWVGYRIVKKYVKGATST